MLRRGLIGSRWMLLLAGVTTLTWLPLSFAFALHWCSWRFPEYSYVESSGGMVEICWATNADGMIPHDGGIRIYRGDISIARDLAPHYRYRELPPYWAGHHITLPLWLLAAVCLAWPVTSLLARRRRRGRGFEVEAKDGGAVSTADS